MPVFARVRIAVLAAMMLCLAPVARAQEAAPPSAVAWRLLDYIAVDYAGAVQGGRIVSTAEYAEMQEFAASVRGHLAELPERPQKAALIAGAESLSGKIARKADPADVASSAHALAGQILAAYPTPLAPNRAPDLQRGDQLYAEQCASCHGVTGRGDGPAAEGLEPKPVNFSDIGRARQRSLFGLYQVISQGLDGTAMPSFAHLSSEDRWALAFHVGGVAFDQDKAKAGERLWRQDAKAKDQVGNLNAVTQVIPAQLAQTMGEQDAEALVAYLRHHPEAVSNAGAGGLKVARQKLAEALAAYRQGDRKQATALALAAYLDGFEPVEPTLRARDAALMGRVEGAMGNLRATIARGAPEGEVAAQVDALNALFGQAENALAPERSSALSSFLGAFTILLREGLEALLIVVAMIAFLRKAERHEVLPYVHGGWVAALAAGVATWWAATELITISGASRELMEGFGSLLAAVVLVSVGVWMHGKSQADAWQRYIQEKLTAALSRGSAWFLFLLAFVVVYREVFETILFFAALWTQGGREGLLAGIGAAVLALAAIAWILLSYSRKLPIAKFFSYSAILVSVLAVVLAGKGVAGLQEAGLLPVHPLADLPRVEILGVFPTVEGLIAQLLTATVIAVSFWQAGRQAAKAASPAE